MPAQQKQTRNQFSFYAIGPRWFDIPQFARTALSFTSAASLVLILLAAPIHSAHAAAGMKFKPDGISGSVGVGFSTYKINSPGNLNFKIDQGTFAAAVGEKGFGFMNLYLTISLSYLSSTGLTNYDYTTLSGQQYTGSDVSFKTDLFQAGLGLKFKIIDGYWIRPYVEGGGTGGYYQLKYQNIDQKVNPQTPKDYKKEDSLLDFGQYAEAGVEISFADSFGIRPAARLIKSETKEFDTLAKSKINYETTIYYFSLLTAF